MFWRLQLTKQCLASGCSSSLLCHFNSHWTGTAEEHSHISQLCELHGTVNQERGSSAANIWDMVSLEQCPSFLHLHSIGVQHEEPQLYAAGSLGVLKCACWDAGVEEVWEAECEVVWQVRWSSSYRAVMQGLKSGVSRQGWSHSLGRSSVLKGKNNKFLTVFIGILKGSHYTVMDDLQ